MKSLRKMPLGIKGLDEILNGGLPVGRPVLVSGGPGCGKSMLGMEFLCNGTRMDDSSGLYVSFEEAPKDIQSNFVSCSFGFEEAVAEKRIRIESFPMTDFDSEEAGNYSFDGLLTHLQRTIKSDGVKRVCLDSLHSLFSRFADTANLRHAYSRIFDWVRNQEITTIITSERSAMSNTAHGLEEYLSDCVIHMDHRIRNQISKRRLRVVKYRGSAHGLDEYPFLISAKGISLLPITSLGLDGSAPDEFVSTGIEGLDRMLNGKGCYRGSTVLVSGGAGTGKSTIAACFAEAACKRAERSLLLTFEESTQQILRNMRSVGLDLKPHMKKGVLRIEPVRPGRFGLEEHLVRVHMIVEDFKPETVVIDPVTSFSSIGDALEIRSMLTRLLDHMKMKGINTILTSLTPGSGTSEESETEISSIVDTWITIQYRHRQGVRRRLLQVYKARGIAHNEAPGELILSGSGPTVKPDAFGVISGSPESETGTYI